AVSVSVFSSVSVPRSRSDPKYVPATSDPVATPDIFKNPRLEKVFSVSKLSAIFSPQNLYNYIHQFVYLTSINEFPQYTVSTHALDSFNISSNYISFFRIRQSYFFLVELSYQGGSVNEHPIQ